MLTSQNCVHRLTSVKQLGAGALTHQTGTLWLGMESLPGHRSIRKTIQYSLTFQKRCFKALCLCSPSLIKLALSLALCADWQTSPFQHTLVHILSKNDSSTLTAVLNISLESSKAQIHHRRGELLHQLTKMHWGIQQRHVGQPDQHPPPNHSDYKKPGFTNPESASLQC